MYHVSEMYLPPIIVPLALLCGLAGDAYRHTRKMGTVPILAIALAGLISSILTIRTKIDGLRDVGDRAAAQIDQILAFMPPDARDRRIAIIFDPDQLPPPPRTYSVYRMGDEMLLVHPTVLEWPRPGMNLRIWTNLAPQELEEPPPDPQSCDLILRWDVPTQKFIRAAP
jgi:hypothetical protein